MRRFNQGDFVVPGRHVFMIQLVEFLEIVIPDKELGRGRGESLVRMQFTSSRHLLLLQEIQQSTRCSHFLRVCVLLRECSTKKPVLNARN